MCCLSRSGFGALASLLLCAPLVSRAQALPEPVLEVTVDSAHHEVVIRSGPYRLPAMAHMHDGMAMDAPMAHDDAMMPKFNHRFVWPVDGMGRGFHMELRDAAGTRVPKRMLHHMFIVNTDRRQLLLPMDEKMMAIGQETSNLMLPSTIGLPLTHGTAMRLSVMWHNESDHDVDGVYLNLRIKYSPANLNPRPVAVLPISMDLADMKGRPNTFAIPAGKYTVTREFVMPVDAHLLGVSGHMHDWGTGLRLEEAESGKVIVRLVTTVDSAGRITHMPTKLYGISGDGVRLRANRKYRVVATYDNRTGMPVDGAMAHIDGLISVDNLKQWPAKGSTDMAYTDEGAWKDADRPDLWMPANMPMDHATPAAGSAVDHQH